MNNSFLDFLKAFRKTIIIWIVIVGLVIAAYYFGVPKKIIIGGGLTVGWITGAFAGLLSMLGLIPLVGPIIVGALSLPVIWLLNGLGYFVSIVAIKKGYTKDVISYRVLTVTLLIGIIIGYVLARVIEQF